MAEDDLKLNPVYMTTMADAPHTLGKAPAPNLDQRIREDMRRIEEWAKMMRARVAALEAEVAAIQIELLGS